MTDAELDDFIDKLYDALAPIGVHHPVASFKRELDGSVTVDVLFSLPEGS